MSGFIPMVSSSPPPMDDGGGFDWDDDDEFGNFTGPDESFSCQPDTKENNNRNEVNDSDSGNCEEPSFHNNYIETSAEDTNAINHVKDQRPNSIEFIKSGDQSVDPNTGSGNENFGETAGTLSDSGLFSSEVSPVPQSGDNVRNGKSQSEYDSQEDLSSHSSPEKSCDKEQLQESRIVPDQNEETDVINSSENRIMEPGVSDLSVTRKNAGSENVSEDSLCNSGIKDLDKNSTCCDVSDTLSNKLVTCIVDESSEQLTNIANVICKQTNETCDTSPSTTELRFSAFNELPNETNENSGSPVNSIDNFESTENKTEVQTSVCCDSVESLTDGSEQSVANITTQLSGYSQVQSSKDIETENQSDSETQQTVELDSGDVRLNLESGSNLNGNDLSEAGCNDQEIAEEERNDTESESFGKFDVDKSQQVEPNQTNDVENDDNREQLKTSNVVLNDASSEEDDFGDFNDVNDDFNDFSAASNEKVDTFGEFEHGAGMITSVISNNEVQADYVNGEDGNEDKLSVNSEQHISEVDISVKESTHVDLEDKNEDVDDDLEFGNFSANETLKLENSNTVAGFGNFENKSKDEVEVVAFGNFSSGGDDFSKSKDSNNLGGFEEKDKGNSNDTGSENFSATGDDFSKFGNSDDADDFGNFEECADGFSEFSTASEAHTVKDDGGWAAFSEAETGDVTSANNDDDDSWADFAEETVQPQEEEPVAQESSTLSAQKNIQHMSKGEKLTYAVTMCFPANVTDESTDIHLDDMGQILSDKGEAKQVKDGLQDMWRQIRNLQSTDALAYQWTKSQWNNKLFATLHVDTQNILIGHKKTQVPIFASGLTLLEPTKGPSSGKPDVLVDTSKSDIQPSSQSQMGYDRAKGPIKNARKYSSRPF